MNGGLYLVGILEYLLEYIEDFAFSEGMESRVSC